MGEYIRIRDPGAVPILAVHNESVVECDEKDVEKGEAWLEKAMIDGMDEIVNGLKADAPLVPIEVEVESGKSWVENSASRGDHLRPLQPPQPFCRVRSVGLRYASCALVYLDRFT